MGRRPTVYDVAARAGVSIATVSFAFTQPGRVRKSTLEAVLAAAGALGYVPSASARGLARGRTGALGLYSFDYLLVPDSRQPPPAGVVDGIDLRRFPLYVDEVQWGVQLACRERGYALMLGAGHTQGNLPELIDVAGRVDGLIALTGSAPPEAIARISALIPVVELGRGSPAGGVWTVPVDNQGGMRALTAHLIEVHGRRRMVYLGERGNPEFGARYLGFAQARAAAGLPVPDPVHSRPGDPAGTAAAVTRLLRDGEPPEALVCATDQEALVAIDTLVAAGVAVPGRVAVTGFDGTLAGRLATPSLTTVRQPMEQIGRAAVDILAGILDGAGPPPAGGQPLPTTFLPGSSCGCRPAGPSG